MSAAHEHDANHDGCQNRMGNASVAVIRPEEVVASIWADVLELDSVAADDDFFELGGDSLSAIQILTRIGQRFNFKLTEGELFTARTVRGLCELLQHATHGGDAPAIGPVTGDRRELPATSAQRRLWFLDRFIANPEVYSVPFLIRMQGDVDIAALRSAFECVEARHEVLRVHLESRLGQPVQVLGDPVPFDLPFVDLRALPEAERRPHLTREVQGCAATPISLDGTRLYRAKLYRTGTDEFFLWLNMHHAITDGWSWGVLFKDVETYYEAIRAGQSVNMPPLPIQYGDFAAWQQEWTTSAACREQMEYWKRTLHGPVATLDLPFSKSRPKMQTFRGGYLSFELPKKLLNAIDKLSRQESVTRFMIGLAAFQTVLHRYTGQDDLLIGSPVANRNRTEVEPLLGMFVNTLILRTNLAGDPTFRELLERVRQTRLGAFAHQDVPLETLLEELRPARDTSRQPYFQTAFYYQNVTIIPERLGRHKLSVVPIHNGTSMFDLRMVLEDGAFGSVWGWVEFNTDLYDEASMKRLIGHFLTVLDAACANPNQRLAELPLLTANERQQLVHDWNATTGDYPAEDGLTEAFTRLASATPEAPALYTATATISYGELNQRANQLAHYLRANGLQAGEFVAVGLPRTSAMIVAVLAISKAGGAYVPLDINYPSDRLAFMLNDAKARWLLTHSSLRDRFPAGTPIVCLDELAHEWADSPRTNPERRSTPDTVAYVIYTSGSTGKPKGVVVRHRAAVNTIDWVNRTFGVQATDKLLFVTSLSFDLSVYDIFGVLGAGGSLRITTEQELRDPAELVRILRDEAITMWDSAPAALQQCVPFFGYQPGETLRLVMLSGDWIPVPLPDQIRTAFPNAKVMSLGGATEAAIWSNWYPIGDVDPTWPSIPYGQPIRNARYHVLNSRLQPQPIGVPGELFIGGVCLADGYLHRPELTAERFISDPFQPDTRLYRTGDLARYLPDGQLQFLGRMDQQVKVRGFRVEVGEIEATLSQHPAVREAIVRPFRDDSGVVYLAAYIVQRTAVDPATLTQYLQTTLPEYMVPSAFVLMEQLPTTPNGKVDRAALQPPTRTTPTATTDDPPQGPLEGVIAEVFRTVLNLPTLGRTANFFELGGHSLKAAQLVARLQETLGIEIKLGVLFDQPTIAGLAQYVQQQQPNLPSPLQRDPTLTTIAPMAPTQRRFWMVQQLLRESATYNVCDVVRITGPLDLDRLTAAIHSLVERHETLRTVYRDTPDWQQVILPPTPIAVPCTDLSAWPEMDRVEQQRQFVAREARRPFDLSTGPVCRFYVVKHATDQHALICVLHHIAFDESSRELLLGDLLRLYEGGVNPWPVDAPRYTDIAAWEHQRLNGAEGERLLAAWREQLANAATPATYPPTLPRPAKPTNHGETFAFTLPADTVAVVTQRAKQFGTTPFVVYTAAFQALLARVSGQDDICVLTPAQVRPPRAKNIVGCFVNTLPLRTSLADNPTFSDLVGRVRATVTHALAHASLPYDRLVDELRPTRGPDGQPLAQTALIHDHAHVGGMVGSLRWQLEHVEGVGAKFDLTIGVTDTSACWIEYRTDLYTANDAHRIAAEFSRLLTTACHEPATPLHALPILAADEERLILQTWVGTTAARPTHRNIVELLDQQASRTPNATALLVGRDEWSYARVHADANRLARHLQSLGVGPETFVGVCMERTAALPVALLAVLKAGGAYVPLDPAYPADRLAFVLDDAQAHVLLTQRTLAPTLPSTANTICVDDPQRPWDELAADAVTCPATIHHPAYVIYTSGSTGKPKGVVLEHRSVLELLHWGQEAFTPAELSGVLFSTSICFDLSIFELFVTWAAGGTVILAPHALALPQLPAKDRVTLLNTVPSAANELVRTKGIPESVRVVNLAGEPLPIELAKQLYAVPTVERVCNLYGPTEDTTYSTWCVVPSRPTTMHVGQPLPNTVAYILDSHRQPVPIGVAGELYLGGAGLARGYHRRPELTAEKFLVHDLWGRLYRTGDLCRWRDDGTIEYLGRIDHQVKVRGFRIELGEIENVLVRDVSVKQAVVVAADDPVAGKRLIAYVAGHAIDTAKLREFVKQALPEYMVPGLFVVLPELPQTPNGKIDRKALPAIDVLEAPRTFAPPANDAERALQQIWQDVLRVAPISVTMSFEELGGHSLAAAAIMARVDGQLGHKLPLETIFKAPTIRLLAEVITQKLEVGGGVIVPLNERGSQPPLFLIAGAGGHVFAFHKFSRLLGDEFPVYGMKAIGVEGDEPPLNRIEAIAARYLTEILRVRPTGPYVLGGYSVGGIVAFELALQMQRRGLDVARVIVFDTFAPGYPRKRAWPIRMAIHAKNFLATGDGDKWGYLSARYRNIRERLYRRVGLGHLVVPEPPGVGGLSATVLRRVWAALDVARLNYWPRDVLESRVVVMRSDKPQQWAATKLDDPHLGWNRWTTKPVQAFGLPAAHMELFGDANIELLVADIRDVLSQLPNTSQARASHVERVMQSAE